VANPKKPIVGSFARCCARAASVRKANPQDRALRQGEDIDA
jgi:hypothetical protein